jgi:hypothetical protein
MRKRLFVKEVSETFVELRITLWLVTHFEQTLFDAEGIAIVFPELVVANFGSPAGQVFAVEE